LKEFRGYHSEWNLGSPGGWDYQRLTQKIAKSAWQALNRIHPVDLDLDFDFDLIALGGIAPFFQSTTSFLTSRRADQA
jgi:hypothetical protein